jgi:D-sedoheptulose 7-phosphate isomerase
MADEIDLKSQVSAEILESIAVKKALVEASGQIGEAASVILERIKKGGKLIVAGNGGSAADAQHIVAELVGRYRAERKPLPAIALTTNSSSLTAMGNDYAFEEVFSRPIQALASPNDVFLAISTSGNSGNILTAIRAAKHANIFTIGLGGKTGGKMRDLVDLCICVPSDSTPRIQEAHILIGHIICGIVEDAFTMDAVGAPSANFSHHP